LFSGRRWISVSLVEVLLKSVNAKNVILSSSFCVFYCKKTIKIPTTRYGILNSNPVIYADLPILIDFLVRECQVDPDFKTGVPGRQPLLVAFSNDYLNSFKQLLLSGSDPTYQSPDDGATIFYAVAQKERSNSYRLY